MDKNTLKDLTVQGIADLYDRSSKEDKQWIHDNMHLWSCSEEEKINSKKIQLKNKNIVFFTKTSDNIIFVTKTLRLNFYCYEKNIAMEKRLERIIARAINRDVKAFYNDIEAMGKLRKRFENIKRFICNSETGESEENTAQLIEETERIIFELDKKIMAYHNESNSDKFMHN